MFSLLTGTYPINRYFEINPSAKLLIPVPIIGATRLALNLGAAFSTNLAKWALRPEIGYLFVVGGGFIQFSLGLSLSPGAR
jgi:hypothetical protein